MSIAALQLVTVTEVADTLGLSRSKVYELLAAGELPSVRIGRRRRIVVTDLERFVERHRIAAVTEPPAPTIVREGAARSAEPAITRGAPRSVTSVSANDAPTLFEPPTTLDPGPTR